MDKRLEELKIIRDKKRKEFEIANENLNNYKLLLINNNLNSNYKWDDINIDFLYKECYSSPLDFCVYLEDREFKTSCLFCGVEE